jgi:hypothetical protein
MENPLSIRAALDAMGDKQSTPTVLAFLLLAGIWHNRSEVERLVEGAQLETLGLTSWNRRERGSAGRLAPPPWLFRPGDAGAPRSAGTGPAVGEADMDQVLREAILAAMESGESIDTARAVALATVHPDRLVRVCAQISALELYQLGPDQRQLLRRELEEGRAPPTGDHLVGDRGELEDCLREILQKRLAHHERTQLMRAKGVSPRSRAPGLLLIHGTTLWGRPYWSTPTGPLFNYIRDHLRSDVYSGGDFFRWEGSYTHYGREVAARSLNDWVAARKLEGIDAACHSHGGNVLLKATEMGGIFGHVLLLSCPVRRKYKVRPRSVITVRSLRVKFDLVILADRARQSFPPTSGIDEQYLPLWFNHSATTQPENWQRFGIRV